MVLSRHQNAEQNHDIKTANTKSHVVTMLFLVMDISSGYTVLALSKCATIC
jgi:hypothetical protein